MKSNNVAKVPIMIGFTKEDGLLTTATLLKNPKLFEELRFVLFMVLDKSRKVLDLFSTLQLIIGLPALILQERKRKGEG